MNKLLRQNLFLFICSFTLISVYCSLTLGSVSIPFAKLLYPSQDVTNIILELRIPRTLAAFSVGALLALAGLMMQVLLQNPMADPYVLGTSSGAAFFSLLFLFLGFSPDYLVIAAWIGSLLSIAIVLLLSKKHQWHSNTLMLVGIAIATLFSALTSLILLLSKENTIHSMLFWMAGDLNGVVSPFGSFIAICAGSIIAFLLAPALNILSRGTLSAKSLGIEIKRIHLILYLSSALLIAFAVSTAGTIGFVGLTIPHIARYIVGFNHARLIPATILLGGTLLTIADTIARTLCAPEQLPVGIVMAVIGTPVFIYLVLRCKV